MKSYCRPAFLIPLLLALFFITADLYAATITQMRVGIHGSRTRVVLESDAPLKYSFFTLPNPSRVVLDLGDVTFATTLDDKDIQPGALITAMRQGTFKPGTVRMVLDAKQDVKASVFTIPSAKTGGARLVVDIYPVGDAPRSIEVKKPTKPTAVKSPLRKEQEPAPVVRPEPDVVRQNQPIVIVLDPGHGGIDPGARGKSGTKEKDIVLQVAKRLQKKLEAIPNTKVHLTRSKDVFVPLADRVAFAQRRNADLFISIHADAHSDRSVSGGSVYVLSERSSDREAARLAKDADKGDIIAGIQLKEESAEVRNILIDLTQRETLNKSSILAQSVIKEFRKVTKVRNKSRPLFAGFRVLKAPEIPSILVELTYISNPTEERNLKSWRYQDKLATSLQRGVKDFMDKNLRK